MRVDISDGQFHKDLQYMKTFQRFYLRFNQNFMHSLILFVLRLNLDFSIVIIICDKYRGIVDLCPLDRATRLLPGLPFVIELEVYAQNYYFVDVQSNMAFLLNSLQIVRVAWSINFQGDFPNTEPKAILSRNIYIIRSVNNEGRGIGETQPQRSFCQIKQSAFACSEVTFNRVLMK